MQLHYTKAALTALWVLAIVAATLIGNVVSTANWIVLVALAAIPPITLWQLWNPPAPSMSDNIRKALQDS